MAFLDRNRAERLLAEIGADALVLFQPEHFTYATGAAPGVAAMWRRAGASIAVIPADGGMGAAAVVGDLQAEGLRAVAPTLELREHRLWVDTVDLRGLAREGRRAADIVEEGYARGVSAGSPRPATFDPRVAFGLLGELLRQKGIGRGRIAADLEFLPAADFHVLSATLPEIEWIDGSAVIRKLRAVKNAQEIIWLREALRLAEAGFRHVTGGIAAGQDRKHLSEEWRASIAGTIASSDAPVTGHWDFISVGPDPWSLEGTVEPGSIIKIDAGVVVAGYSSDTARSYVFGEPDPLAAEIYSVLGDAFECGLSAIRPGVPLHDVYAATASAMHAAGLDSYQRGHFGHSLGASVGSEEWPFIAADSDALAEPGMVLAFETPFYAKGIGSLTIEDQLLVTETGIEVMTTLPRRLLNLS